MRRRPAPGQMRKEAKVGYSMFVRAAALCALLASGAAHAAGLPTKDHVGAEIEASSTALQATVEKMGCLVTAAGSDEPAFSRILDLLNDGERNLREARRLAQGTPTQEALGDALMRARQSRALVGQAETLYRDGNFN